MWAGRKPTNRMISRLRHMVSRDARENFMSWGHPIPVDPEILVDEETIKQIEATMVKRTDRVLLIPGRPGSGKTSLVKAFQNILSQKNKESIHFLIIHCSASHRMTKT